MFNMEEHNQMAPEQYGSQKEKSMAIQCLNKCLLYDYVRYTHIPLAVCSNDAKSCYNRIVLIIAALSLCRLGADKVAIQSMLSTLHGMQHHVRSMYGDSKTSQGCKTWGSPITGIGQGNGAGPQIWAAVNTPLFQILTDNGFLALVVCAISKHCQTIVGFSFVDNTDLCVTAVDHLLDDRYSYDEDILHELQKIVLDKY